MTKLTCISPSSGFVAIVYTWDNVYGYGEPEEWRTPQVFPTEAEPQAVRPLYRG